MADDAEAGAGGVRAEPGWPSVDGPLGASPDSVTKHARLLFYAGFFLLPWLWFANCFYFWPVLRNKARTADPKARQYIVWSGLGFLLYSSLLLCWALTFSFGGEGLLGSRLWKRLCVYEIAGSLQL